MPKINFKNDKYKNVRGGHSKFLNISCQKCGEHICNYQKDGPGNLRRMYIDRIIDPRILISHKDLSCSNNHLLGVKIIYNKENRPAFRLLVNVITKKMIKSL